MNWQELNDHELVVYKTTWCPDCTRFEKVLDQNGIKYSVSDRLIKKVVVLNALLSVTIIGIIIDPLKGPKKELIAIISIKIMI